MRMADCRIRPLTSEDEPLLWDMLYQALIEPDASTAPPREIVDEPQFARFVKDWGRREDRGFVALEPEAAVPLGAVWFRGDAEGAPRELAFAVPPEHRRRGIAAALLTQWVRANPGQSEVLLRVGPNHPAVRLYERFGFRVVDQEERCVTLRRDI